MAWHAKNYQNRWGNLTQLWYTFKKWKFKNATTLDFFDKSFRQLTNTSSYLVDDWVAAVLTMTFDKDEKPIFKFGATKAF